MKYKIVPTLRAYSRDPMFTVYEKRFGIWWEVGEYHSERYAKDVIKHLESPEIEVTNGV